MLNPDTAKAAKDADAAVIFLDVPFETCYERIKDDTNRPIVVNSTKEQLEELYNSRRDVYIRHSTIRLECSGSPVENADKIAEALRK